MVDMPATIENFNIDFSKIGSSVADLGPLLSVIRNTWSHETISDIMNGKLFVPDDVINEQIAKRLPSDGQTKSVTVTSHENGRMDILADTKSVGRVKLTGTINELVHNTEQSYIVFHVEKRSLQDNWLLSQLYSMVTLSLLDKMFGHINLSDDVTTKIDHGFITIDFRQLLLKSDVGTAEFQGYKLIDMFGIEKATPKEGGVELDTTANIPDSVKTALLVLLKSKL